MPAVVAGANVSLQARTHEYVEVTDAETGVADFNLLPAGDYTLFARWEQGTEIADEFRVADDGNDNGITGEGGEA